MVFSYSDSYAEKLSTKNIIERRIPGEVQVHTISDLHCDRSSNVEWWKEIVNEHKKTLGKVHHILIIAGDISHQLTVIEDTLSEAKRGYDDVFFIPGNHEMWCTSKYSSSLQKCVDIVNLCKKLDVSYFPVYYPDHNLLIAPIWSWYHASWDTTQTTKQSSSLFKDSWVDFHLCKWPSYIDTKDEITSLTSKSERLASYFASINEPWLQTNKDELLIKNDRDLQIISFSHFVPLEELIPKYLHNNELRKVSGSNPLRDQLSRLKPNVHIFGHTHLPVDTVISGVRYLQWSLGTGKERSTSCSQVNSCGPLCVYNTLSDANGSSNGHFMDN